MPAPDGPISELAAVGGASSGFRVDFRQLAPERAITSEGTQPGVATTGSVGAKPLTADRQVQREWSEGLSSASKELLELVEPGEAAVDIAVGHAKA